MNLLKKTKTLQAITLGQLIPLHEVGDPVFSQKMMGDGLAFKPKNNVFYAPCDGQISFLAETKHAIGITCKDGLEIIIHIGIDTVALNGEGFIAHQQEGDWIKAGDKLIELTSDVMNNEKLDLTTPLIVTNYKDLKLFEVSCKQEIMSLEKEVIKYKI